MVDAQAAATASSPDLKVAAATLQQAGSEITVARYQYLPSFGLDFFYGIDANHFAITTRDRQNLGYVAQATLNIPVWNWGATRSKIKQAELKRDQSQLELTLRNARSRAILRPCMRRRKVCRGNSIRCEVRWISRRKVCA